MCTRAPVVGVSSSKREAVMAAKLMHMDRAMLHLIVFTVALDSRFKYGILEMSRFLGPGHH